MLSMETAMHHNTGHTKGLTRNKLVREEGDHIFHVSQVSDDFSQVLCCGTTSLIAYFEFTYFISQIKKLKLSIPKNKLLYNTHIHTDRKQLSTCFIFVTFFTHGKSVVLQAVLKDSAWTLR